MVLCILINFFLNGFIVRVNLFLLKKNHPKSSLLVYLCQVAVLSPQSLRRKWKINKMLYTVVMECTVDFQVHLWALHSLFSAPSVLLWHQWAIHISAHQHLPSFPGLCHRPVFDCLQCSYCKQSKTGSGEGLGTYGSPTKLTRLPPSVNGLWSCESSFNLVLRPNFEPGHRASVSLVPRPSPACVRKRVWCSERLFLSQLPDLRAWIRLQNA